MTLEELVQFICTSTGYVESDDQAACRTFVLARDRMIYDSALWKDSLVLLDLALDPANADHAAGIVLLPEVIGRPVAVRTARNSVRVNGLETYFRYDYDKFPLTGEAREFAILSPIWMTIRPGTNTWETVSVPGDFTPLGPGERPPPDP